MHTELHPIPALFLLAIHSPFPIGERGQRKVSLFSCSPRPARNPLGLSQLESQIIFGCNKQEDSKHRRKLADITKQSIYQFT